MLAFVASAGICPENVSAAEVPGAPRLVTDNSGFGKQLAGEDKRKMLDTIRLQTKANFEQIRTAKGTYHFFDGFHFPGSVPAKSAREVGSDRLFPSSREMDRVRQCLRENGLRQGKWEIIQGDIRFALDNTANKYHAIFGVHGETGFIDAETGKESIAKHPAYEIHWTLTPEYVLHYDSHELRTQVQGFPSVGLGDRPGSPIVYVKDSITGRRNARIVDVREFFGPSGRSTWSFCETVSKALSARVAEDSTSSEDILLFADSTSSPTVTLVVNFDDHSQTVLRFDSSAGWNCTHCSEFKARGSSTIASLQFEKTSGIFFPKEVEIWKFKSRDGQLALSSVRQFSLVTVELNQPVPAEEFNVTALNVPYAGWMLDELQQKLFVRDKPGRFVPAADFRYEASLDPVSRP
jgi:hypothetical protein